ncbi:CopD family protein [Methylobacillus sp.]|uniref:CopD family protein n=1 Tax=Methylobacillus sp. TaxID=56818 RepID=UPI002FE41D68
MYSYILLAHILAATVWTGGHLVLSCTVLPRALKQRNPELLLNFEAGFEYIGMPALLIQIATGFWMAHYWIADFSALLAADTLPSRLLLLKLALLAITILTAIDARFRLIPYLNPATLPALARRITLVTIASVGFVLVGVSFRGGLIT